MAAKSKSLKITITQKDWDKLDAGQKAVMKKLGIVPKKTALQRRKEKFFAEAETYILGIYISCNLCGRHWSEKWKMMPAYTEEGPHWQGYKIPRGDLILEDKVDEKSQVTCCKCYKRLRELPKEIIIKKLVAYARYTAFNP